MAQNETLSNLVELEYPDYDDLFYVVDKSAIQSKKITQFNKSKILNISTEDEAAYIADSPLMNIFIIGTSLISNRTITLPSAFIAMDGATFMIKDVTGILESQSLSIIIETEGSEQIDGSTGNFIIDKDYGSVRLVSNGTYITSIDDDSKISSAITDQTAFSATYIDTELNAMKDKFNLVLSVLRDHSLIKS